MTIEIHQMKDGCWRIMALYKPGQPGKLFTTKPDDANLVGKIVTTLVREYNTNDRTRSDKDRDNTVREDPAGPQSTQGLSEDQGTILIDQSLRVNEPPDCD